MATESGAAAPRGVEQGPSGALAARPERARAAPVRTLPATKPAVSPGGDRSLGAELRALERSQRALALGRGAEAQQALDEYEARFPRGELGMEAELLQIDVLVARGEQQQARALARALSLRPASARYRARLQGLLGSGADSAYRGEQKK
jgi:hypothetical protein